jgi:probable F420-dependent oxidoreductase
MKFAVAPIFARPMPFTAEFVAYLAELVEQLGFESLFIPEHVALPVEYTSPYPYAESGLPGKDDDWPSPFVVLAFAAAVTKRIKLGTCVTILPEHHPINIAKELATLDVLTNGRTLFGVGTGWNQEEMEALGWDFRTRGKRTDEAIEAIRKLWKEDGAGFEGKTFSFKPVRINPKPLQKKRHPNHNRRQFAGGGSARGTLRRRLLSGRKSRSHAPGARYDARGMREDRAARGRDRTDVRTG